MIIGNGMLAKAFHDCKDVTIFASGVSNSLEEKEEEFQREEQLLCESVTTDLFVYFSSCSLQDPSVNQSAYCNHKLNMEKMIPSLMKKFNVFRLPQVVGKTNNQTVINFLFNKIKNGEHFELWSGSYRNFIDVDDVVKIITHIIQHQLVQNKVIDIAAPINTSILTTVEIIESVLKKKADYTIMEKGLKYDIDSDFCSGICKRLDIDFDDEYVERTIRKYYA